MLMNLTASFYGSHGVAVRPGGWLLLAAVGAAVLDLGFAMLFWAADGVPATRILQSIATWLMGPAAYQGGVATAVLGSVLYVALMWTLAALYCGLSRSFPRLVRQPVRFGLAYGALMYGLVFHIAVPLLTAAGPASQRPDWIVACIAAYMVLVGLPCAWAARRMANDRG
jgi:hypothetical protein